MQIHHSFKRYNSFNPNVPVWCLTSALNGCMHRFFNSSAISPSGKYVAVFQLPFEDRQPEPGETGNVFIIDLMTGSHFLAAQTCGWEPQLGANIYWGSTDNELFFNDVDTKFWTPFAWKIDPFSNHRKRLNGTVYQVSPNGRWLLSPNITLLRKIQSGYGVVVPKERLRKSPGLTADDGFFLTDAESGDCHLLVSIKDLILNSIPKIVIDDFEKYEFYGSHCEFNRQGTKIMMSLAWFEHTGADTINFAEKNLRNLRFAWFTMDFPHGQIFCPVGPNLFSKGAHHAKWCPDGEHISLNLRLKKGAMRFISFKYDGTQLKEIVKNVIGSGHPSVHPNGYIVTDTYLESWDYPQFGDGTVPIRWIDIYSRQEIHAIRIPSKQPCEDFVLRVDPHPTWDSSFRYLVFNGYLNGSRRVFLADMNPLIRAGRPVFIRKITGYIKNFFFQIMRILRWVKRQFISPLYKK